MNKEIGAIIQSYMEVRLHYVGV